MSYLYDLNFKSQSVQSLKVMSHIIPRGGEGGQKSDKKCDAFFEWPFVGSRRDLRPMEVILTDFETIPAP